MIHSAVAQLLDLAPQLTDELEQEQLDAATRLLDELQHPLSPEEIEALISLLPASGDTAFGLSWTILHAIEASPAWPIWRLLQEPDHEWQHIFRHRLKNAGETPT